MFAQFAQQGGALVVRQRPDIGASHRRGRDRNPRADVELNAERQPVAALAEIDHAVTVAAADRDRAAGLRASTSSRKGFGQMPNAEIGERGIAERHRRRRQLIFLEPRNRCKIAELGQRVGQPRNGRLRQVGAGRDLLIAEKPVVGMECAQHIEAAGQARRRSCDRSPLSCLDASFPAAVLISLTRDVLQNNPPCQDVELNSAVRNQSRTASKIQGE